MRYSVDEVEEAASLAAFRIARNEHRLTVVEMGLEGVKMEHGNRLRALEEEAMIRNAAIIKAARGLIVLLAGIVIDLKLNGGALLRAFFAGSP
jgi:hypothetical protein